MLGGIDHPANLHKISRFESMTEFLLVHGMGQGAWTWGKVWGRLTAPVEHPPRLQITRQAGRVSTLDLPGHGSDAVGDTAQVRMEECVHAIVRAVEREGLKDVVLVGHDFAGSLISQAARQLSNPPKRLVMLAGIVPPSQRSMLAVLPTRSRAAFRLLDGLSKMSRQDLRLPRYAIGSYLCNGMSPMELVEVMGFFGPLPVKVITSKVPVEEDPLPCPVTYVTLSQDRLVPPEIQLKMAHGLPDVEIVTVNSCHQAMLKSPKEVAEILGRYA